jgi:subtilisin family serine protease
MAAKRKKRAKRIDPGYAPAFEPLKTPDYVILELRHDSRIGFSSAGFGAPSAAQKRADSLNSILEGFKVEPPRSLFGMKASQIRTRSVDAPSSLGIDVSEEFAHCGFVELRPRRGRDCADLARRLGRLKSVVWEAVVAPRPVPAAMATGKSKASRNFEPAQGYLHSPPNGIGAMAVWKEPGGRGKGVTICDIEGNWNRRHQDLPRGIPKFGGTLVPGLDWRNHGTAVLGEMVSLPNDFGTVGISHGARAAVQSAVINGVWNTAGAIMNAVKNLRKGDVILIELQGVGPNGRWVAMQYWTSVFSAIRAATKRGITVVEAAGNGNEDFDDQGFANTGLQKDSGAIVVGAGVPPTNWFDAFGFPPFPPYGEIGVPRSRIWFSNYGKIVNVQAWGWHVTTLGYGDAQGGVQRRWYTLRFSGTSSASPIVTGAVALVQAHVRAKTGSYLPPADVRKLLIKTGTPQQPGPGVPLSQRIGPQPDLERAFAAL